MPELSSKSNVPSFSAATTELHLICGHNITSPTPTPYNTCGQGAIIIMKRDVNGNPVSYNAEGAQAFSVICSYVLKVAKFAYCLSVTGKNSYFCVARIRLRIRIQGLALPLVLRKIMRKHPQK
jgi:hypothetical protein